MIIYKNIDFSSSEKILFNFLLKFIVSNKVISKNHNNYKYTKISLRYFQIESGLSIRTVQKFFRMLRKKRIIIDGLSVIEKKSYYRYEAFDYALIARYLKDYRKLKYYQKKEYSAVYKKINKFVSDKINIDEEYNMDGLFEKEMKNEFSLESYKLITRLIEASKKYDFDYFNNKYSDFNNKQSGIIKRACKYLDLIYNGAFIKSRDFRIFFNNSKIDKKSIEEKLEYAKNSWFEVEKLLKIAYINFNKMHKEKYAPLSKKYLPKDIDKFFCFYSSKSGYYSSTFLQCLFEPETKKHYLMRKSNDNADSKIIKMIDEHLRNVLIEYKKDANYDETKFIADKDDYLEIINKFYNRINEDGNFVSKKKLAKQMLNVDIMFRFAVESNAEYFQRCLKQNIKCDKYFAKRHKMPSHYRILVKQDIKIGEWEDVQFVFDKQGNILNDVKFRLDTKDLCADGLFNYAVDYLYDFYDFIISEEYEHLNFTFSSNMFDTEIMEQKRTPLFYFFNTLYEKKDIYSVRNYFNIDYSDCKTLFEMKVKYTDVTHYARRLIELKNEYGSKEYVRTLNRYLELISGVVDWDELQSDYDKELLNEDDAPEQDENFYNDEWTRREMRNYANEYGENYYFDYLDESIRI